MNPKTVLLTGASSGIGRATAEHFQQQGWNVIATMRTPDDSALHQLDNVLVTRLDVTDLDTIIYIARDYVACSSRGSANDIVGSTRRHLNTIVPVSEGHCPTRI